MRKFYLLFAALFAGSVVASAGIKNLYKQDFELASTPADANWISPSNKDGMAIAGDEFGKYFSFTQSGGGERNAYTLWGTDIYGEGVNKYTLKFEWNPQTKPDTNLANEIVVMADSVFSTNRWQNQNYRKHAWDIREGATEADRWWLFDLTELTDEAKEGNTYAVNGDSTNVVTINFNSFYTIKLDVDVEARTVDYDVADEFGNPVTSGKYNVPENVENLRATGLNVLGGKVGSVNVIDNIVIQVETAEDYANAPTVALVGVNGTARTYAVSFEESNDEIVHVTFDGAELTPDEVLGGMNKYNLTSSGKLVAWTESGSATSEKVEIDVVAENIALPAAVADVAQVNEGYVKSYKISVDNSTTPTQPAIFINIKYTDEDGTVEIDEKDQQSGTYSVKNKGTLELTTWADGFEKTTVTIANDVEYVVAEEARLDWDVETCLANGNLAAYEVNDVGNSHWDRVYSEADDKALEGRQLWGLGNPFNAYQIKLEALDEVLNPLRVAESEKTEERNWYMIFPFEGLVYYNIKFGNSHNVGVDEKYISDDPSKPNFFILNVTSGYDRPDKTYEQTHSVQVIKTDATYAEWRFDTAISAIKVLTYKGFTPGDTAIKNVNSQIVNDNAPIYNLNGARVSGSLKKGVYVKQGKKFIVQ